MSVSHTRVNNTSVLGSIAEYWGIGHKIQVIVKDMVKAIKSVSATSVLCFAHTLNLIFDNALTAAEDLEEIRTKVRGMVTIFHHLCKVSDFLTPLQESSRHVNRRSPLVHG